MKIRIIFFLLMSLLFNKISIPQNDYTFQKFFKSSNKCKDINKESEEMECNFVRIIYPQFSSPDYSKKLNNAIKTMISSIFWEEINVNGISFDEYSIQFFKEYKKSKSKYNSPMDWFHDIKISVESNNRKLTSLFLGSYYYLGGAHGCIRTITLNYNKKTNKIINIDDIFNPYYETEFNLILNKLANEKLLQIGERELENEIDFFDVSKYYYNDINKRFIITDKSITIYFDFYDSFELRGLPEMKIEIPFNLLTSILNFDNIQ